ncbi:uncharacterized protein LOC100378369 [Saccoglossus kowalevskii]|uniref:MAP7 domain-containing protein 2-like n=1 Tax=Saccoglossus kowalevskii TaxID=10224 RepID=A0ABM0GQ18_SACKO|nr:PREDICTED: MAP7 domain-containing protein 2-like [Saccoglossus kowalevskii]
MGCGSSSPQQTVATMNKHDSTLKHAENNNHDLNHTTNNGVSKHTGNGRLIEKDPLDVRPNSGSTYRDSGIDSAKTTDDRRMNGLDREPTIDVKKSIAYDIPLEGDTGSLVKRHPPKKFQVLRPRDTNLTVDMMADKQKVTEIRRQEELQKRAKSARRTSKRRKEIMAAREYEKGHQEQQEKIQQISEKMEIAEKQRARAQHEKIAKQKLREEKARQARERAKRIKQLNNEELNFDLEKDDTFNANDDVDSWLDGYNSNLAVDSNVASAVSSTSERIYDGRSSPVKRYNPLTSAEARKRQLDPMDDNDEFEIGQDNQWAQKSRQNAGSITPTNDNFFDS